MSDLTYGFRIIFEINKCKKDKNVFFIRFHKKETTHACMCVFVHSCMCARWSQYRFDRLCDLPVVDRWACVCVRASKRKWFKRLLDDRGLPNEIILYCECKDQAVIQFEENIRPALNWESSNLAIWTNKGAAGL